MFKSVTKWLGVDRISEPEDSDTPNDAVAEIADSGANEKWEDESAAAAVATQSSKEAKQHGGPAENVSEDDGANQKPEENTTEESGLQDNTIAGAALHKLEDATAVAYGTAKLFGNFLYSFGRTAGVAVVEQASKLRHAVQEKRLLGDLVEEQEKFASGIKEHRKKGDAVAPWVGYHEEETMKQQIVGLSTERKNFLEDPPSEAGYKFDFTMAYPVALATLREDANLREMRFELVPKKLSEERFWRNYFYRVSLIKETVQLNTLQNIQTEKAKAPISKDDSSHADDTSCQTTLTQTAPSLHSDAHVESDLVQDGGKLTSRVIEDKAAALTAAAAAVSSEEKDQAEEEDEQDDSEEWDQVLEQELEEFLKIEKESGDFTAATADCQQSQRPKDDDPELLDQEIQQQIKQEAL